jgi:protein-S-isoprenylcysteine O-methyltransferase Ste14
MKNNLLNYLTLALIIVAFPILIVFYLKAGFPINSFTYIGLALIIPSLVFFTIARIQLGSSFQVSAEANKLVTEGLYKKIRHPVYLFGLLFLLGFIIFIQMFYLLVFWGALIFLQRRRIKKEEKVLEEKFGEQYVKYKNETWF